MIKNLFSNTCLNLSQVEFLYFLEGRTLKHFWFFSFGVISPFTAIILFYVPLRQGFFIFNLNFIYNNQYTYYTIFCTLMSNKHLVVV